MILYDKGVFQGIMDRLKERLSGLGAKRIHKGRASYWKLTPGYRWFQDKVDRLVCISRGLRKDREIRISIYDDEELALPAESIFSRFEAGETLNEVTDVLNTIKDFLKGSADKEGDQD